MKKRGSKHIEVSIYHEVIAATAIMEKTEEFKKMRGERQWEMEGTFAEAKNNHCLGRARYRGRSKMQIQAYMTGVVQNLKRLTSLAPEIKIILEKLIEKMQKLFFCKFSANFFIKFAEV